MDDRLRTILGLLAELHGTIPSTPEKRDAVTEQIVFSLGGMLRANLSVLLRPGFMTPIFVEHQGSQNQLFELAAGGRRDLRCLDLPWVGGSPIGERPASATSWSPNILTAWLESFESIPADGLVYLGSIIDGALRFGIEADPKQTTEIPANRLQQSVCDQSFSFEDDAQLPFLTTGVLIERQLMRLIFIRDAGFGSFSLADADLLAGVIEHLLLRSRLVLCFSKIADETVIDELTQVYNYRFLKRSLRTALRDLRSQEDQILSVVMIDVDNLRAYNDRFGHLEASAVLAQIGNVLRESIRGKGWVAKYGGDEFLACLPAADKIEAIEEANQLRRAIEAAEIGKSGSNRITCSFGVATAPRDGMMFVDLLEAAFEGEQSVATGGLTEADDLFNQCTHVGDFVEKDGFHDHRRAEHRLERKANH